MTPSVIQVCRYALLPFAGLVAGCGAAWAIVHCEHTFDRLRRIPPQWILVLLMISGLATMGWMVTARYLSWHSFVLDLGSYDQKVWLIAQQSTLAEMWLQTYKGGVHLSPCGIERYWGICHFQPWLLIPATIYKIWDSPLILLWLQVALVVSGVIPAYLLARDRLESSTAGVLAGVLYLLYPAVQYNGVLDYRPDHVAIPAMLWAYVLAARGKYLTSLGIAGLAGLAKETLILNAAFFGLYLALRYRQRMLGATAFFAGVAAFYVVTFHLLQFNAVSEGALMIRRHYPELSAMVSGGASGVATNSSHIVGRLIETHKLFYLYSLFLPLALLPFLAPAELIPAIPSLAISLLSTNPNVASIESQYSASMVGPALAALIVAVTRVTKASRTRLVPQSILSGLVALSLLVSVGLSPSVLSLNFWDPTWGGRWQEAQYRADRQAILNQATLLIPTDPKITVVTQNDVNAGRLAHRYGFFAFPYGIERAGYVLLDTEREPYVYWMWDPQRYQTLLNDLRANPAYEAIFAQEGVVLFKHHHTSYSDLKVATP